VTGHLAADNLAAPLGRLHYACGQGKDYSNEETADERNWLGQALGFGFFKRKLWRPKRGVGREAR
jgi:hypothetical protein